MGKASRRKLERRQLPGRREEDLVAAQQQQGVQQQLYTARVEGTVFRGPLPPPEILEGYNDVIENGADRIITMAEKNQNHRHELENAVILGGLKNERRGQVIAGFLFLALLAAATYLISIDKDGTGVGILIAEFLAGAALFMNAQANKRQEMKRKRGEG